MTSQRFAYFVALLGASAFSLGMQGRCEAQDKSAQQPESQSTQASSETSGSSTESPSRLAIERAFKSVDLALPVWMEQPPGDSSVWFAVEQKGTLVRFKDSPGARKSTALDIRDRVKYGGERGFLGLAFHPDFQKNGHIFVNYTTEAGGPLTTRVSRFTANDARSEFDPKSEKVLLSFRQTYANHNGGQVSFGPDGYLYIGVGDGGSAGDPKNDAQNPRTLLGTILRIDVDASGEKGYGIPDGNAFTDGSGRPEIYAWGLRNPWRFSWDPKTEKLWVADVGQNAYEEINIVEAGENYGWRFREGKHCYKPKTDCRTKGLVDPVHEYSHKQGDKSITGGYVYRGKVESLAGHFIYGDFVSGRIWALDTESYKNRELFDTSYGISSFARAADGRLFFFDYGPGHVYQFVER